MELAINVTIVGFTVVFLALLSLTVIISLFGKLLNVNVKKDISNEKEDENVYELVEEENENLSTTSDDELIAVLTAAITASLNDSIENGFRVKSFRRIPQSDSLWNTVARNEQVLGKLRF